MTAPRSLDVLGEIAPGEASEARPACGVSRHDVPGDRAAFQDALGRAIARQAGGGGATPAGIDAVAAGVGVPAPAGDPSATRPGPLLSTALLRLRDEPEKRRSPRVEEGA